MHPDQRREASRRVGLDVDPADRPSTAKGGKVIYNAANDGIGVAPFYDAASKLPADIQTKLDTAIAGMKDGSVVTRPPAPACGKTPAPTDRPRSLTR